MHPAAPREAFVIRNLPDNLLSSPWVLSILSVLSFLYFAAETYFYIFQWNTEGVFMVAAYEIYHGATPYKDFVTAPTPGFFYLLAGIFKIFGPSFVLTRILTTCLPKWLLVIVTFKIARSIGLPHPIAILGGFFSTLAIGTGTFSGADYTGVHPTVLSTLGVMASALASIKFISTRQAKWMIFSGAITGFVTILRYDLGLYTFLAQCAFLIALKHFALSQDNFSPLSFRTTIALYVLGLFAILGPMMVYFILHIPHNNLILSFWEYPKAYLQHFSRIGISSLIPNPFNYAIQEKASWFSMFLAWWLYDSFRTLLFVTYGWSLLWLRLKWKKGAPLSLLDKGITCLIFWGLFLWGYFIKSSNVFSFSSPCYIILPALIFIHWDSKSPAAFWMARLTTGWIAGLALLMFLCKPIIPRPYHRFMDIPHARGLLVPEAEAIAVQSVVRLIQLQVPKEEKILVSAQDYDVETPLLFYILTDRRPATAFFDFFLGFTTKEDIQKHVISDILSNRVQYIVQKDSSRVHDAKEPKSLILSAFIQNHFKEVVRFGSYRILKSRDRQTIKPHSSWNH